MNVEPAGTPDRGPDDLFARTELIAGEVCMEAYLPTDRGAKFVQSARPTHTYDRLARRSSCLCVRSYNMAASSVRRYSPMHAAPRRGDNQGIGRLTVAAFAPRMGLASVGRRMGGQTTSDHGQ